MIAPQDQPDAISRRFQALGLSSSVPLAPRLQSPKRGRWGDSLAPREHLIELEGAQYAGVSSRSGSDRFHQRLDDERDRDQAADDREPDGRDGHPEDSSRALGCDRCEQEGRENQAGEAQ